MAVLEKERRKEAGEVVRPEGEASAAVAANGPCVPLPPRVYQSEKGSHRKGLEGGGVKNGAAATYSIDDDYSEEESDGEEELLASSLFYEVQDVGGARRAGGGVRQPTGRVAAASEAAGGEDERKPPDYSQSVNSWSYALTDAQLATGRDERAEQTARWARTKPGARWKWPRDVGLVPRADGAFCLLADSQCFGFPRHRPADKRPPTDTPAVLQQLSTVDCSRFVPGAQRSSAPHARGRGCVAAAAAFPASSLVELQGPQLGTELCKLLRDYQLEADAAAAVCMLAELLGVKERALRFGVRTGHSGRAPRDAALDAADATRDMLAGDALFARAGACSAALRFGRYWMADDAAWSHAELAALSGLAMELVVAQQSADLLLIVGLNVCCGCQQRLRALLEHAAAQGVALRLFVSVAGGPLCRFI